MLIKVKIHFQIKTLNSGVNILLSAYKQGVHAAIIVREDQGFSSVENNRQ